ncbi:MAG: SatD family protein [Spirochaetota bacterium]|nr:SatD family protein [Spirochaetota bacterium]
MQYYALVGDIRQSRQASDRKALQELLLETLKALNNRYSQHMAALLMGNAGDAFQGLFLPTAPILQICDGIRYGLSVQSGIRIGLGFGAIETAIDPKQSILADGPAFWNARAALQQVQQEDYYGTRTLAFCLKDKHLESVKRLVNQVLVLHDQVSSKWKNTQLELARHYLLTHGFEKVSQTRLAKEMGLSTQQINTTIQAMGWFAFLDTRRETEQVLLQVVGGNNP